MSPADAVRSLRSWAASTRMDAYINTAEAEAAIAACVLIDHCAELERALDLLRAGHDSVVRGLPANAVHGVAVQKRKR